VGRGQRLRVGRIGAVEVLLLERSGHDATLRTARTLGSLLVGIPASRSLAPTHGSLAARRDTRLAVARSYTPVTRCSSRYPPRGRWLLPLTRPRAVWRASAEHPPGDGARAPPSRPPHTGGTSPGRVHPDRPRVHAMRADLT